MKKILVIVLLCSLFLGIVSAADLSVKTTPIQTTVINEIDSPAKYTLEIKNNGPSDTFQIYSLAGVNMGPSESFVIDSGKTVTLEVTANPQKLTRKNIRGKFIFEYQIKGESSGFYTDKLELELVEFKDAFEVSASPVSPDDSQIIIFFKNKVSFPFGELGVDVDSGYFSGMDKVNLNGGETKEVVLQMDKDKLRKASAGSYPFEAKISHSEVEAVLKQQFNYLEKGGIAVYTNSSGGIIRTTTITKVNEGNVPVQATTENTKNIFSRLFTSYSEKPTTSQRKGFFVYNSWSKRLGPGEALQVVIKTNYTLPFIFIIIVILVGVAAKISSQQNISVDKRVSLVKTRGGEFALKIRLKVKARSHADNLQVIDTLPRMASLYEKFGTKPDKIDPQTRRMTWNISRLNAGEERVFTYIIYSKINIVGNFELPTALVIYEKDGRTQESRSNKTFFSAETTSVDN